MTQLQTIRFKNAENERNQWFVVPEAGTPFEALLDPSYWAHVSAKLRPCDEITINAEDGAYYGRLLVQDAGKLYAKVAKIEYVDLEKVEVLQGTPGLAGHEVKWKGPVLKWCVMRGVDVLKDGMQKSEALTWLGQYGKTLAA